LEIPWQELSAEALKGVIEEFVTRLGTDNGYTGAELVDNIQRVRQQLASGEARITFDPSTETCNIVRLTDIDETST